jgi:hypothetical protein
MTPPAEDKVPADNAFGYLAGCGKTISADLQVGTCRAKRVCVKTWSSCRKTTITLLYQGTPSEPVGNRIRST